MKWLEKIITCRFQTGEALWTKLDVSVSVEKQMFQMEASECEVLHNLDLVVAQVQPSEAPQVNECFHLQSI